MNVLEYLKSNDLDSRVLNGLRELDQNLLPNEILLMKLRNYKFVINHRAKNRHGCVNHHTKVMELTSEYFTNPRHYIKKEDYVEGHHQTLLHETAHIITRILYPHIHCHHGHEWKYIMRLLGCPPDRCSSNGVLKDAKKRNAKHSYTCTACNSIFYTSRRLKNITFRYHPACGPKGRLTHTQLR